MYQKCQIIFLFPKVYRAPMVQDSFSTVLQLKIDQRRSKLRTDYTVEWWEWFSFKLRWLLEKHQKFTKKNQKSKYCSLVSDAEMIIQSLCRSGVRSKAVSYTHLTLPTKRIV